MIPLPIARTRLTMRARVAAPILGALLAASTLHAQSLPPVHTDAQSIAEARADSVHRPYTTADIEFVDGMIQHHAQAILMANWAPSHDAGPEVSTLCGRIINAQLDEIHRMQQWLADRRQTIPSPTLTRGPATQAGAHDKNDMADMPGMHMDGTHLMPGMLTAAQLDTLDHARGKAFDRYFLIYMMQHHRGAVAMVKDLFSTYGAAQDDIIFKMASDINVDQTTEIARMQRLLASVTLGIDVAPPEHL